MEKQIINNGRILIEKGNLVHLMNKEKIMMVFECVDIDHGYLVLEPLDSKRFGGNAVHINEFCTNKPIVKGLIEYGNRT